MNRYLPLSVLLLASASCHAVLGCECVHPGLTVEKALEQASVVFSGNVTALDESRPAHVALFEVLEVFKGNLSPTTEVWTSPALCGVQFLEDRRFLVYAARRSDGILVTAECSRTSTFPDAEEDVAALRRLLHKKQGP